MTTPTIINVLIGIHGGNGSEIKRLAVLNNCVVTGQGRAQLEVSCPCCEHPQIATIDTIVSDQPMIAYNIQGNQLPSMSFTDPYMNSQTEKEAAGTPAAATGKTRSKSATKQKKGKKNVTSPATSTVFPCNECPKFFTTRFALLKHIQRHRNQNDNAGED